MYLINYTLCNDSTYCIKNVAAGLAAVVTGPICMKKLLKSSLGYKYKIYSLY